MPDTEHRLDEVTGVVLAGGRSERMGRPKAWLPWGEVPLLTHIVNRLGAPTVVVAAEGQALPPLSPATRVVHDRRPGEGPLHGLARGLEQVRTTWAFVVTTDAPFVARGLGEALRSLAHPGHDAVVATVDGHPQPLLGLYRPSLGAQADRLLATGERRARTLATQARTRRVTVEELRPLMKEADPELRSFLTLNTPEDYERALNLWRGAS